MNAHLVLSGPGCSASGPSGFRSADRTIVSPKRRAWSYLPPQSSGREMKIFKTIFLSVPAALLRKQGVLTHSRAEHWNEMGNCKPIARGRSNYWHTHSLRKGCTLEQQMFGGCRGRIKWGIYWMFQIPLTPFGRGNCFAFFWSLFCHYFLSHSKHTSSFSCPGSTFLLWRRRRRMF
jgi:hypothetical protein